jgi:hypothetical protein
MKFTRTVVVTAILSCVSLGAVLAAGGNPGIVPIDAQVQGKTYSELGAAWWQWALETPTPKNPVLDTTGQFCQTSQKDHIWFLAGTLFGGTVERTCSVPAQTYLFFPLANDFYGAFLTDPPETRTEEFIRAQAACIEGAAIEADIDGVPVINPAQYLEKSVIFDIHLPKNNVFGVTKNDVPELTLSPSADEGYYLFLYPLTPGSHTIHFSSSPGTSSCAPTQDITYHLNVGG